MTIDEMRTLRANELVLIWRHREIQLARFHDAHPSPMHPQQAAVAVVQRARRTPRDSRHAFKVPDAELVYIDRAKILCRLLDDQLHGFLDAGFRVV